jgi:hypothetical protein
MHLVREGITLTMTQNSRKRQWGERREGFAKKCREFK